MSKEDPGPDFGWMPPVGCKVKYTQLPDENGKVRDAVVVTCTKCGQSTDSWGHGDASVRRCFKILHMECHENNFYKVDPSLTEGEPSPKYRDKIQPQTKEMFSPSAISSTDLRTLTSAVLELHERVAFLEDIVCSGGQSTIESLCNDLCSALLSKDLDDMTPEDESLLKAVSHYIKVRRSKVNSPIEKTTEQGEKNNETN